MQSTTPNSTQSSRSPFSDTIIISGYEIALFTCAAALLVAAYVGNQAVAIHGDPVSSQQAIEAQTELMMEVKREVEAQIAEIPAAGDSTPGNTTVLLDHNEPELLAEAPAAEPAS